MFRLRSLSLLVIGCVSFSQLAAQSSPSKVKPALTHAIRTLFAGKSIDQTAISPDGSKVAWVESANGSSSAIYVSTVTGADVRRITAGKGAAEDSIAWAPDSKRIAFLSDAAQPGQAQLYVAAVAGGSVAKLTSAKGFLASPSWSPDGKTIAVLFTENATRAAGPLVAETAQTGVIKEAVTEQRLALVGAEGGKLRQISPPDI